MTGFTLQPRAGVAGPVELLALAPGRLRGLGADAVRRIVVTVGGLPVPLGDAFDVAEGGDEDTLVLRTEGFRADGIGQGMAEGRIVVQGDAGDRLGARLRGGQVTVEGRAGSHAGAAMAGGIVEILGDAGDFLGAAMPAEPRGMTGGLISVRGSAGARAGERMRRGTIIVDGAAGEFCGAFMVAGTVAAGGACGAHAGYGMRRGTLLLGRAPAAAPEGFVDAGSHDWVFLSLLQRHVGEPSGWLGSRPLARARRLIGDMAEGGRGEILIPE
ncbi:formylmethanofuran dehydrogenase subunit C [Arenibaculum pallidiluteum]|uniref:formylmethanofuran dehydrogenase subunit C n=1 Tax=Arenibaculum pallidiluteum TaxID=2812559 RepID=UPI001A977F79|nr:formylmethanofuran dehydrogenase subunit C [Arenibaculum pallidiluteum]